MNIKSFGTRLGARNMLLIGGGVIVVLLVVIGALFIKYSGLKKDSGAVATSNRIIQEVSNIYAVPANEQPTVALVQDKSKLKEQPFFNTAENGDYILVYTNNKLAIVYRENEHKLIKVGPITVSDDSAPPVSDK